MVQKYKRGFDTTRPTGLILVLGLALGAFAATLTTHAFGESGKSKTTISEDVYKALFGKKRATESDQKRARTNTAIMGIRGLDDDSDSSSKITATANMRAVYQMEDRTPNQSTVDTLQKQLDKELSLSRNTALPKPINNTPPSASELEGEIDLGRKMAAQVLGANKTFDNERVLDYVTALTKVVSEGGLSSGRPFRVAILNSHKINAFACPGGYIFVTKGALRATQSEAQLAALLGHEIVHVSQRHLLTALQRTTRRQNKTTNKSDATDPNLQARQRIKPDATNETATWAQVLGPKGVGLSLLQASSEALDTLLSKGLDKEFELEADRLGQQVSAATGYDSHSLVSLLTLMKKSNTLIRNTTASTHPAYDLRIESVSRYVETMIGQTSATAQGSSLYLSMQKEWMR